MGGFWQLLFASYLLVQSLSAEGSMNNNSTSAVNNNSTNAVNNNSTNAVNNNSTTAVNNNSTNAVNNNSTAAVNNNSTTAVNPDEELEKNIGKRIASLREMGQGEIRNFTDLALQYYNMKEDSVFTALEDGTVTVKKAIGSMVSVRMTLEKTNCSRKDVNLPGVFRVYGRLASDDVPPKYCGPLTGDDKAQLDCKFDLFKNERSYGEAVVSHVCKPVRVIGREIFTEEDRKF